MKEELKLIHRGSDELINEKELVEKLKEGSPPVSYTHLRAHET